jgi:DNA-binding NtrC family response regulator
MVGGSPAFTRMRRAVAKLAPLRQPVLLQGETGTGKDLAAAALHDEGVRARGPFVAINCAALPGELAESELFGHLRGAFTGAHRDHQGAFRQADTGTLFLDEVAELPLIQQAKLLRTMETGQVRPVGSDREVRVDVRVVAATHRPLHDMVAAGMFREDLYHRLAVLTLEVPPLRERPEDIPSLLEHFARLASDELNKPLTFTASAVRQAVRHPWPGNIRALRNAVLRAGALHDGPIEAEHLLPTASARVPHTSGLDIEIPRGDWTSMERALLQRLVHEHGSIRKAALALGVPRSTLGAWLRKHRNP